MRIAGNYTFEADREEVWLALNDPEVLARAIPGCQKLEQIGENEYESTLKIGLQAVKGVYNGHISIQDLQPPQGYKLVVNGKGSNGFVKGEGTINLRQDGAKTIIEYGGEAQVGGTIASVGQRLLDGAAKTLINQSLKALSAQITARRNGVQAGEAAGAETRAQSTPQPVAPVAPPVLAPVPPPASPPASTPVPAHVAPAAPGPAVERRSVVIPPHEQLSESDVVHGIVDDFLKERPWFPWVIVAFLLGYIFGRRK
ncbi:MAG: carbon monoxide dehydrogenase subunit G [Chloroflexales bacterium]|nr:carbon monoxide dehydrogenase subunit G [Chloroflexales bacterium]